MESPKSYSYLPSVNVGHALGSTAINSVSLFPSSLSLINGYKAPAKLLPPPTHAIIVSGSSLAISSCVLSS